LGKSKKGHCQIGVAQQAIFSSFNCALGKEEAKYQFWSQSYDRELQRQRCKFLQRHG
jgi:hypothetical protein